MPLTAEVLSETEQLTPSLESGWDALAVEASRPFCAPAWLLAWWAQAAPDGCRLRLVMVRDGQALVGVAPCFASPGPHGRERWSFLGGQAFQRVEPLAARGREAEAGAAMASAFAGSKPAWVSFDGIPADSPWPALLAAAWPGTRAPRVVVRKTMTAPCIDLAARDFDAWYMDKTSHFRQRLRKARKDFGARGGTARLATEESVDRDLATFVDLHTQRWARKEGETAVTTDVARMLAQAGGGLPVPGRLRVWTLEIGDDPVSSSVVLGAGDELGYWANGFDERHKTLSPSRIGILTVIEDAFASGARRLDLGAGDFEYKRRFADDEETLHWSWLVPPGGLHGLVRLRLASAHHARTALARLPPEHGARVRAVLARVR